jgi:vancomycin resistance protein VanJ
MSASLMAPAILRVIWKLALAASLLYGSAITGYLLARIAVGERWNWIAYANNFIPWWALGNTILIVIALFSERRGLLIACQLPGIIAFLVLYGRLLLPRHTPAQATAGPPVTFATYNILSVASDPSRIQAAITALDAGVIGLVEVGPVHAQVFAASLAEAYPYQVMVPGLPVSGVGLLSRCPIVHHEMFQPRPDSMFYLRAVIDLDGVPVTVYVVHPPPPRNVISPFTYDDDERTAEIKLLHDDYLAHETGPLIVLGDFNMTDQSDSYRQMDDLLHDTFREAGRGMGFTFPASIHASIRLLPPLLRIDYVWHSDHFGGYNAYVAQDGGTSDHQPVVARLVLHTPN